jgi:hypothetical protein
MVNTRLRTLTIPHHSVAGAEPVGLGSGCRTRGLIFEVPYGRGARKFDPNLKCPVG